MGRKERNRIDEREENLPEDDSGGRSNEVVAGVMRGRSGAVVEEERRAQR